MGRGVVEEFQGRYLRTAAVDLGFFEALDQPMVAGRAFNGADLDASIRPVVVNTAFVEHMLDGRNAIGRRVRFVSDAAGEEAPWREIVGVVGLLGMNVIGDPDSQMGVYTPSAPGELHPVQMGVHLTGDPEAFTPRLRELVTAVDPNLVVGPPSLLGSIYQGDWYILIAAIAAFAVLVLILVTLAASGLYAIMSFSVAERTREIGIRTALGVTKASLLMTLLRRSLAQIAIGALIGMPLAGRLLFEVRRDAGSGSSGLLAAALALGPGLLIVTVIGIFSCAGPARRALRIEPAEALRAEA